MATLTELVSLMGQQDTFFQKVKASLLVNVQTIIANGSSTAAQKVWASRVLRNPDSEATAAYNAVLAANNGVALASITGATDAQINTAVAAVIPTLVG